MHNPNHVRRRRRFSVLVVAIAVGVLGPSLVQAASVAHAPAAGASATAATGSTTVSEDPNNYTCVGHIRRGAAEQGVPGTQVSYQFACDGPITGYAIETEPHQIRYFDQSPVVALKGVPSATDGFSCNAFLPGVQVNCTGSTSAAFEVITGQFVIADKQLCAEPRLDPILTVADATAGASATVTQYLSGPYDLGRPWGCKGDRYSADTRLGSNPPTVALPGPPKSAKKRKDRKE